MNEDTVDQGAGSEAASKASPEAASKASSEASSEAPAPSVDVLEPRGWRGIGRRRPPNGALILAAALVFAVSASAVVTARGPDRHEEGGGELAMHGGDGEQSRVSSFSSTTGTEPVTFGLELCHLRGDIPVLEGVAATDVVGSGFRVVGTGVRTFVRTQGHTPIYSVDGWPPNPTIVPDPIAAVAGYQVTSPCPAGNPDVQPYTELLVAMERTSPDGGGWFGFEIAYTVGGRHRVLHSSWRYGLCGTSISCTGPVP